MRLSSFALFFIVAFFTFREVRFDRVAELLLHVGAGGALLFIPFGIGLAFDTAGWRAILEQIGRRVRFLPLFRIRLSVEALSKSALLGTVWGEGLAPVLLSRQFGAPLSQGVSGSALRKYFLILSQGLYLAASALLGWTFLSRGSRAVIGADGLPLIVLVSAGVFFVISSLTAAIVLSGNVSRTVHGLLLRVPIPALKRALERARAGFAHADDHFKASLAGEPVRLGYIVLLYFVSWIFDALETFLILRLLGAPIDFQTALAIEPAVALLRHLAFFVPVGIGVQEAAYAAFLRATGAGEPLELGAAFCLLKRAKELAWIALGYLLLLLTPRKAVAS